MNEITQLAARREKFLGQYIVVNRVHKSCVTTYNVATHFVQLFYARRDITARTVSSMAGHGAGSVYHSRLSVRRGWSFFSTRTTGKIERISKKGHNLRPGHRSAQRTNKPRKAMGTLCTTFARASLQRTFGCATACTAEPQVSTRPSRTPTCPPPCSPPRPAQNTRHCRWRQGGTGTNSSRLAPDGCPRCAR
jgi:hypothetical protein